MPIPQGHVVELLQQGAWAAPDWLAVHASEPALPGAVWKALREAQRLGFIEQLPRLLVAREANVAIETTAPTKAQLILSYRISGAGWLAAYDARLDTSGAATRPMKKMYMTRSPSVLRYNAAWRC